MARSVRVSVNGKESSVELGTVVRYEEVARAVPSGPVAVRWRHGQISGTLRKGEAIRAADGLEISAEAVSPTSRPERR